MILAHIKMFAALTLYRSFTATILTSVLNTQRFLDSSRIGNNLNQLTQYFHMGGLISASMQELLRDCINDVMDMRKEVMKLGGDYRGYSKTHRK